MQEIFEAIILGIVQGLTEFLPVSSSGHLELFNALFDRDVEGDNNLLMTITLHGATALSTVVVFRKEIADIIKGLFEKGWNKAKKWTLWIAISTIPAGLFFIFLEDWITALFTGNVYLVAGMLVITGVLLLLADMPRDKKSALDSQKAWWIGVAQALAIIPGISRSGATISTSVLLGLERGEAARFSFLMVLPLIFGKVLLDLVDGDYTQGNVDLLPILVGSLVAFLVGCWACKWMVDLVRRSQLKYFSYYCFIVAVVTVGLKFFL
jgi:undecaprenyl-diphosphatase